MRWRTPRWLALLLPLLMLGGSGRAQSQPQSQPQRVVDQGIQAEFAVAQPAQPGGAQAFSFRLSDTAGGSPMRGLRPAAWLSQRAPGAQAPKCTQKVASYLGGDVLRRADVDLNSFFVLTLNDDATVSVVDPLFGFGGSKLLTLLQLESRGADWALARQQALLVVSMPEAGKVALIDTRQWRIVDTVRTGGRPRRVVASGGRVWISSDDGVIAIDTATRALTVLPLGGAVADITASADGAWLFASNGKRVAIIDARAGRLVRQVDVDGTPSSLAYSSAAQAVYAIDAEQGKLFVINAINAIDGKPAATVELRPGAAQIRFTPDGRYALLPNPAANLVQVLDAASNRIAHTVAIADGPDQITFSDRLAYVRRRDSEIVLMISLDQLGNQGGALGLADFPGGQHAFGQPASLADNLVGAPEGGSMLVANAADRMVYMYSEGMAAPAGGFSTYAQTPRAVLVVDHGLREVEQGVYATTMPVRQPGLYDVVMFNDSPRMVACFATTIAGDAAATAEAIQRRLVRVTAVDAPRQLVAGHSARLRFALSDADGHALPAAADVRALAFAAPGVWQRRTDAKALPGNVYEIEFIPPRTGVYYVWIESESLGLPRNNAQFKIFQAVNDQGD